MERKTERSNPKVDKGLEPEKDGVQLMKPIPNLAEMCDDAIAHGVFGTKMRSVINFADLVNNLNLANQSCLKVSSQYSSQK